MEGREDTKWERGTEGQGRGGEEKGGEEKMGIDRRRKLTPFSVNSR